MHGHLLIARRPMLPAERGHRIDPRGTAGGDIAGEQADCCKDGDDGEVAERVPGHHTCRTAAVSPERVAADRTATNRNSTGSMFRRPSTVPGVSDMPQ